MYTILGEWEYLFTVLLEPETDLVEVRERFGRLEEFNVWPAVLLGAERHHGESLSRGVTSFASTCLQPAFKLPSNSPRTPFKHPSLFTPHSSPLTPLGHETKERADERTEAESDAQYRH